MSGPTAPSSAATTLAEIGILWTLEREHRTARCVLYEDGSAWELQLFIEDQALIRKRGQNLKTVCDLAQAWRSQLHARGWTQPAVRFQNDDVSDVVARAAED